MVSKKTKKKTSRLKSGKRAETREKILKGATRVFIRRGFQSTLMQDIADQAQVGKGTLYEYFPSKEELFIEVCLTGFETGGEEITEAFNTDGSLISSLNDVLDAMFDETASLLTKMPLYFTLWGTLSFDPRFRTTCRTGFKKLYRSFRDALTGGLEKAQNQGEIRRDLQAKEVASAIIAIFDGYLYQRVFASGDLDQDGMRETINALILDGLKPQGRKKARR